MKSVFMALWCFCFILIAVIGCDQDMNMMKPVVQDVMDAKPEDKPDTTVPVAQPVAEVKNGESMMDPTVPEPDVEEPLMVVEETPAEPTDMDPVVPEPDVEEQPMVAEEMPAEPPDMVGEVPEEPIDPYTPHQGLTVFPNAVVFAVGAIHLQASGGGCINLGGATFNGVTFHTHFSKWQRREDSTSSWIDVPGTEKDGGLCAYSPTDPGQYRLVGEISIGGVWGQYASQNVLTVE